MLLFLLICGCPVGALLTFHARISHAEKPNISIKLQHDIPHQRHSITYTDILTKRSHNRLTLIWLAFYFCGPLNFAIVSVPCADKTQPGLHQVSNFII